jgi:hypothetical protein
MTLVEIRQKFVELSGRYDLVSSTTTWADSGANFFITAGQNFLDRLINIPETMASVFYAVAANQYSLSFQQRCRSIKEVWVNNTDSRYQLEKKTLKELKENYVGVVSTIDVGMPLYYCIAGMRALETSEKLSLGTFLNLTNLEGDGKHNYRGIIIAPPLDVEYIVEVIGQFYQPVLLYDTSQNYWTLEVPELLLKAALYQLEIFYRNSEGANDWLRAIQLEISDIEKDVVEEETSDTDMMGD